MEDKIGKIIKADISKEMKVSYLNYAMSVIVSRALPDVRDGLKPVHRRILFDMNEMGLKAGGGFKKSARIVGDVLGKYHPHGDASVYDALVRLAQDFSLRYPVVKPQGNFGSIDGDPAAAMRYTEAKMSRIGEAMLVDLDKETVDFGPNYDDSLKEPTVLPAGFPYLLCNGSSGIAVGMATNLAPHNLKEVCDGLCALIDNPDITIRELMGYIKGPDFPTYGVIHGIKGIRDAYETGRGKVVIRGRYDIEEKKGKDIIVFTEIPYMVNKANLVKKISDLRKDVIKDISEVRDESDREGIRIVIELKKNAVPEIVLNHLFRNTQLEFNFNVNNLALVNNRPKLLTLKDMLYYYVKHREDVITRRTRYNLRKAEQREHILLGLKIGLENIDEVIEIIKKSDNNEIANNSLCERFGLDKEQANAIIQMRLGKLSHLETQEILDELADLEVKIAYYKKLLADKELLLDVVKKEIIETSNNFGDRRRTEINPREIGGVVDKDFIKKEAVIVTISNKGFVRRVPASEYKTQNRGGTGVKGASLRDEDFIEHLFTASSHDRVMIVTSLGRAFWFEVYEIPESTKTGKGTNIRSLLPKLELNENISTLLNLKEFSEDVYILMATKKGVAKRVRLDAFVNARKNGIKAIILDEGDELLNSELVREEDEAMLVSKNGKGLRFKVEQIRAMGRSTHGVRGMKLSSSDEIIGLVKVDSNKRILMITDIGKGKQVEFDQFMVHNRGTQGQAIYRLGSNGNYLVAAKGVNNENDVVCITKDGITIRTHVENISIQGRNASGVNMVRLKSEEDIIVAMAVTKYQMEDTDEPVVENSSDSEEDQNLTEE